MMFYKRHEESIVYFVRAQCSFQQRGILLHVPHDLIRYGTGHVTKWTLTLHGTCRAYSSLAMVKWQKPAKQSWEFNSLSLINVFLPAFLTISSISESLLKCDSPLSLTQSHASRASSYIGYTPPHPTFEYLGCTWIQLQIMLSVGLC